MTLSKYKENKAIELFEELSSYSGDGITLLRKFREVTNKAKNDDLYLEFKSYLRRKNGRTNLDRIEELLLDFNDIYLREDELDEEDKKALKELLKLGISLKDDLNVERDLTFLGSIFDENDLKSILSPFLFKNLHRLSDLKKIIDSSYVMALNDEFFSAIDNGSLSNDDKLKIIRVKTGITQKASKKAEKDFESDMKIIIDELSDVDSVQEVIGALPKGLEEKELEDFNKVVAELASAERLLKSYGINSVEDIFKAFLAGDAIGGISEHKDLKNSIPYLFKDEKQQIEDIMSCRFDPGKRLGESLQVLKLNKAKRVALQKIIFQIQEQPDKFSKAEIILAIKRVLALQYKEVDPNILDAIAENVPVDISNISDVIKSNAELVLNNDVIIPKDNDIVSTENLMLFYGNGKSDIQDDVIYPMELNDALSNAQNYDFVRIIASNSDSDSDVCFKKDISYEDKETQETKHGCLLCANVNNPQVRRQLYDMIARDEELCKKIESTDRSIADFCREIQESQFYRYTVENSKDIYRKLFILKMQSSMKSFEPVGSTAGVNPGQSNTLNRLDFSNYSLSCDGVRQLLEIASMSGDNFYEFEFQITDLENLPQMFLDFYTFKKANKQAFMPANLRLNIKSDKKLSTAETEKIKTFFDTIGNSFGEIFGIDKLTIENKTLESSKFKKNAFIYNNDKRKNLGLIEDRTKNLFTQQDKLASLGGISEKESSIARTNEFCQEEIESFSELDVVKKDKWDDNQDGYYHDEDKEADGGENTTENNDNDAGVEQLNIQEQELEMDEELQLEMNLLYNLSRKPEKTKDIPEKDIITKINCVEKIKEILNDVSCPEDVKTYLRSILTRQGDNTINSQDTIGFFTQITTVSDNKLRENIVKNVIGGKFANKALTKEAFIQCVRNVAKYGNARLGIIGQDPFFEPFQTEKGLVVIDTSAKNIMEKTPHPVFSMLSTYPVFSENTDKAESFDDAIDKIRQKYGNERAQEVSKNIQEIKSKLPDFQGKDAILAERPAIVNPDALIYISRNKSVFSALENAMKGVPSVEGVSSDELRETYKKLFSSIAVNFGKKKPQSYGKQLSIYDLPDAVKLCNGLKYVFNFLNQNIKDGFLSPSALKQMIECNPDVLSHGEQSAGIFYTMLLKAKQRAQVEVIRQKKLDGQNIGDIDLDDPMEVRKFLARNPLTEEEKQIIKTSIDYQLLSLRHPVNQPDAFSLANQDMVEMFTMETVSNTSVSSAKIDNYNQNSGKIAGSVLPTSSAFGDTILSDDVETSAAVETSFKQFLFQERERYFNGQINEGLTQYEEDLIKNRNVIIECETKIMLDPNKGEAYKKVFYDKLINGEYSDIDADDIKECASGLLSLEPEQLEQIKNISAPLYEINFIIEGIRNNDSNVKQYLQTTSKIKTLVGDENFKVFLPKCGTKSYQIGSLKHVLSLLENAKDKDTLKQPILGRIIAAALYAIEEEKRESEIDSAVFTEHDPSLFKDVECFCHGTQIRTTYELEKEYIDNILADNDNTIEGAIKNAGIKQPNAINIYLDNQTDMEQRLLDFFVIPPLQCKDVIRLLVARDNDNSDIRLFRKNVSPETIEQIKVFYTKIISADNDNENIIANFKEQMRLINAICVKNDADPAELVKVLGDIKDTENFGGLPQITDFLTILEVIYREKSLKKQKEIPDIGEIKELFLSSNVAGVFFSKSEDDVSRLDTLRIKEVIWPILRSSLLEYQERRALLEKIVNISDSHNESSRAFEKNVVVGIDVISAVIDDTSKRQNNGSQTSKIFTREFFKNVLNNSIKTMVFNASVVSGDPEEWKNISEQFKKDVISFSTYIQNLEAVYKNANNTTAKQNVVDFMSCVKNCFTRHGFDISSSFQILSRIPLQKIASNSASRYLNFLQKIIENEPDEITADIYSEIEKIDNLLGGRIHEVQQPYSELKKLLKKKEIDKRTYDMAKFTIQEHEREFLQKEQEKIDGLYENQDLFEQIKQINQKFSKKLLDNVFGGAKKSAEEQIKVLSNAYNDKRYTGMSALYDMSGLNLMKAIDDTVFDIGLEEHEKRGLKRQLQYVYSLVAILNKDSKELEHLSHSLDFKIKQRFSGKGSNTGSNKELTEIEQLQLYAVFVAKYYKNHAILLRPEQIGPAILNKRDDKAIVRMKTGTGKTKTIDFTAFKTLKDGKTPIIVAPNEVLVEQHISDLKLTPGIKGKNIYIIHKDTIIKADTLERVDDPKEVMELLENKKLENAFLSVAANLDFYRKKCLQSIEGIKVLDKLKEKGVLIQDEVDVCIDPTLSNKNARPSELVGFGEFELAKLLFDGINADFNDPENEDKNAIIDAIGEKIINLPLNNKSSSMLKCIELNTGIDLTKRIPHEGDVKKNISNVINEEEWQRLRRFTKTLYKDLRSALKLKEGKHYATVFYKKGDKTYADYRIIVGDKITDKSNRYAGFTNHFVKCLLGQKGHNIEPVIANITTDNSVSAHLYKYFNKFIGFTATPKDNDIWKSHGIKIRGFESVNIDNRETTASLSDVIDKGKVDSDKDIGTRSKATMLVHILTMSYRKKYFENDADSEKVLKQLIVTHLRKIKPKVKKLSTLYRAINFVENQDLLNNIEFNPTSTYGLSIFEGSKKVKNLSTEMSNMLDELDENGFFSEQNLQKPEIFALESSNGSITKEMIDSKIKGNPNNLFIIGTTEYGQGFDFPNEPFELNFETQFSREKQLQIHGRVARSGRYGKVINYPEYTYARIERVYQALIAETNIDNDMPAALKAIIHNGRKNLKEPKYLSDFLAKISSDQEISEYVFNFNLNLNSKKEIVAWKKHEAIEELKEEFSDKINIALAQILGDNTIPSDIKSDIKKEIELESSNYLNNTLEGYLKLNVSNNCTPEEFEEKNEKCFKKTKENIDKKVKNMLYKHCFVSYDENKENPAKKSKQYIERIVQTTLRTYERLRANAEQEARENELQTNDKGREADIRDRIEYNRKAFLKVYIPGVDEKGEKIQQKVSIQRVSNGNNRTKIMLSAIGSAIECGMQIHAIENFENNIQSDDDNSLIFGNASETVHKNSKFEVQKKEDKPKDRNADKEARYQYQRVSLKNRAVLATKNILKEDGSITKRNIVFLDATAQDANSIDALDIARLYFLSQTLDPQNTQFIINYGNGVIALNYNDLQQVYNGKKEISRYDREFKDFCSEFPKEMLKDGNLDKKLTAERAKALYIKYKTDGIMSAKSVNNDEEQKPIERLRNDFLSKYKKQSFIFRRNDDKLKEKRNFIVENIIDNTINSNMMIAATRLMENQTEFLRSDDLADISSNLTFLRTLKRRDDNENDVIVTESDVSLDKNVNYQDDKEQAWNVYQDLSSSRYEDIKNRLSKFKDQVFAIDDNQIKKCEDCEIKLSSLVDASAMDITKSLKSLEDEIDCSQMSYDKKEELKKQLQDVMDVDELDDKMDKTRKVLAEAIKLDNLLISTNEHPEEIDLTRSNKTPELEDDMENIITLENVDAIKDKLTKLKDTFEYKNTSDLYVSGLLNSTDNERKIGKLFADKYNNALKNINTLNAIIDELESKRKHIDEATAGISERIVTVFDEADPIDVPKLFNEQLNALSEIRNKISEDIEYSIKETDKEDNDSEEELDSAKEPHDKKIKLSKYHANMLADYLDKKIPDVVARIVADNHHLLFNDFSLDGMFDKDGNFTKEANSMLANNNFTVEEARLLKDLIKIVDDTITSDSINDGKNFAINEEENSELLSKIKEFYQNSQSSFQNGMDGLIAFQQKMVTFLFGNVHKRQEERKKIKDNLNRDVELATYNGIQLENCVKNNIGDALSDNEAGQNLTNNDLKKIVKDNAKRIADKLVEDERELDLQSKKNSKIPWFIRLALAIFPGCTGIPWLFKGFRNIVAGVEDTESDKKVYTPIVKNNIMMPSATGILKTQKAQDLNRKINNSRFIQNTLTQNNNAKAAPPALS